jgi:hypothetical protein
MHLLTPWMKRRLECAIPAFNPANGPRTSAAKPQAGKARTRKPRVRLGPSLQERPGNIREVGEEAKSL